MPQLSTTNKNQENQNSWDSDLNSHLKNILSGEKDHDWSHKLATKYLSSLSNLSDIHRNDLVRSRIKVEIIPSTTNALGEEFPEQFKITEHVRHSSKIGKRSSHYYTDSEVYLRVKPGEITEGKIKDEGGLEFSTKQIKINRDKEDNEISSSGTSVRKNHGEAEYATRYRQREIFKNTLAILDLGRQPEVSENQIRTLMTIINRSTHVIDYNYHIKLPETKAELSFPTIRKESGSLDNNISELSIPKVKN